MVRLCLATIAVALVAIASVANASSLDAADRARLTSKLQSEQKADGSFCCIHVAAAVAEGLAALGATVKNTKGACTYVAGVAQPADDAAAVRALSVASSLFKCPVKLSAEVQKALNAEVADPTSAAAFANAVEALHASGSTYDLSVVSKSAIGVMDSDEGAWSYAAAFGVLGLVGGKASEAADTKAVKTAMETVEDCVAIALESPTTLQFEGGVEVSSLITRGAFALASITEESPAAFSAEQLVKLATFFLQSRFSESSTDIAAALKALEVLSSNTFQVPVFITPIRTALVSGSSDKLAIAVSNALGGVVEEFSVQLDSAEDSEGNSIASEQDFAADKDGLTYTLDLLAGKPKAAVYTLTVSGKSDNERFIAIEEATLSAKVSVEVSPIDVTVTTADTISSAESKPVSVSYPKTASAVTKMDSSQKLVVKFKLVEAKSKEALSPHQVFFRFTNQASGKEVIFVAYPGAQAGSYVFSIDLSERAASFGSASGLYTVSLIVGGATVSNSFEWVLTNVDMKFSGEAATPTASPFVAKPEIAHLFREPEARPPMIISTVFTALVLAPAAVLFLGWIAVGVNVSNFSFSLWSLLFHGGIGAILAILALFWLHLNMFQALGLLAVAGFVTFLSGNFALAARHSARAQKDR
jgi:oligosaccharyltransferase complex subunit delta (ribophorin II)